MTFSENHLPDNLSNMQVISDSAHLLNSVSPTALSRAEGWQEGAQQIDNTKAQFEAIMDKLNTHSISVGTPANDNKAPASLAA